MRTENIFMIFKNSFEILRGALEKHSVLKIPIVFRVYSPAQGFIILSWA